MIVTLPLLLIPSLLTAMGSGSEVAKQAAEIVLADDNFNRYNSQQNPLASIANAISSIVLAVKEGRRIFINVRKFVVHLMATNVAEVIVLLVGLVFRDISGTKIKLLSLVTTGQI